MREWIHRLVQRVVQRQRNIIVMDDNYTRNGSNSANGLQIDRYISDIGSAYMLAANPFFLITLKKLPTPLAVS
jgi:hypothetical protein